jgi:hypothetical protein
MKVRTLVTFAQFRFTVSDGAGGAGTRRTERPSAEQDRSVVNVHQSAGL